MNHIVYITDENYILPTLVSLNSLVKNAAQKIAAHVIAVDCSEQSRKKLESLSSDLVTVSLHDFKNEFAAFETDHAYVSKAALYKFRLPEIFSDLDKILYIDGDIILKWKKVYSLSKKRRAEERRKRGNHAEFKAEVYGFLHDAIFFIESNDSQAQEIHRRTGKSVYCVESQFVYS